MKRLFTIYGAISAISTLLLPAVVPLGFYPVIFLRFLQGSAVATSFPAMGSVIAEWATLKKSGTFIAIVSCHLQLSQIFTMPVAGALCASSLSWPALYYLQGAITVACFVVFWFFYEDSPSVHRNVSEEELTTLQKNKVVRVLEENEVDKTPYKAILNDRPVIGVLCSLFGATVGFQFFFQYGPVYLNQVQGFDVKDTGLAAALPFILSMIVKFMLGPCSDSWARLFIATAILVIVVTTIFNCTAEVTVRPWADNPVPSGAPPAPQVFELSASELRNKEKVGQVLQAKRLSIQSESSQLRELGHTHAKRASIYSVD